MTLERPDVELADDDEDDDDNEDDDNEGEINDGGVDEMKSGYADDGGDYGEEEDDDGVDDNDDSQRSIQSADAGEVLQLARDEAAFTASQSRALVVGDSVHWRGEDADLPVGTTGMVTQVYGDGDVEVLFQGALSENKVFTFEEVCRCVLIRN